LVLLCNDISNIVNNVTKRLRLHGQFVHDVVALNSFNVRH